MKTHLELNYSEIIDNLGGTNAVASICDVTAGAVSQWRYDGIPRARLMYLKVIHPEVFGLPSRTLNRKLNDKK